MDIICKDCGHAESEHKGPFGCQVEIDHCKNLCECRKSRVDVLLVYITEQQFRLDALTAENEKLFEVNSRTWCAYCGKQYPRTEDAMQRIREHISTCEKHPMRQVEAERDALKDACSKAFERLGHCESWGSEVEDACNILSTAIGVKNHGF